MIVGGTVGDSMWTASIHNYYNYAVAGTYAPSIIAAENYDLTPFYPVAIEVPSRVRCTYAVDCTLPHRPLLHRPPSRKGSGRTTADWTRDDSLKPPLP